MPARQPSRSSMPSKLSLSITTPPDGRSPANVLILLHGLGDTKTPFTELGKNLQLPETACIALQGPSSLPLERGGYHWGDELRFDSRTGSLDVDSGFSNAVRMLTDQIIGDSLIRNTGFQPREVLLFGFGQGGMAALAVAAAVEEELGGVISVGGPLPTDSQIRSATKSRTPVLLLGGSSDSLLTNDAVEEVREQFEYVDVVSWDRKGDSMPRNRQEMIPIMQFFARRLRSRAGVPSDAVEVS